MFEDMIIEAIAKDQMESGLLPAPSLDSFSLSHVREAMKEVDTVRDAREFYNGFVKWRVKKFKCSRTDAINQVRKDLGTCLLEINDEKTNNMWTKALDSTNFV